MKKAISALSHALITALLLQSLFLPALVSQGCSWFESPPPWRAVNFDVDADALDGMTPREQQDQLRDWLLLTALADAGLGADKIVKASFDLPAVRHGYLRPLTSFEYGETRSRLLADGRVVALLPTGKPAEVRNEYLWRIADEHRKNTGEKPKQLLLANYDLNLDTLTAKLSPFSTISSAALFNEKNYVEETIKTPAELGQFLKRIDDLTYAEIKNGQLVVGGRKLPSSKALLMRVEDVAAIWQSEKGISDRLAALDASIKAKVDAFEDKWARISFPVTEREAQQRKHDLEWAELKAQLEKEDQSAQDKLDKENFASESGFSLDPHYKYGELQRLMPKISQKLLASPSVSKPQARTALQKALEGLTKRNADAFFDLVGNYNQVLADFEGGKSLRELIVEQGYSYQAARYDGGLRGTEVGMALFYTDLLAKLWLFDYQKSTTTAEVPGGKSLAGEVPGFTPGTQVRVAPIYAAQMKALPGTRIWFGHNDKGFQIASQGDSLLFGRNATRIFAKSHAGVEGGPSSEVPPRSDSEAFIGWWNDHYEEIARYEPEYQRLNQIMKWGLLISWLNQADKGDALDFLNRGAVMVDHNAWFSDWVRKPEQTSRLKFNQWEKIGFIDPANKPEAESANKTELMRLLVSEPFEQFCERFTLRGGVSLPGRRVFENRANLSSLPAATDRSLLRSEIDLNPSKFSPQRFTTHDRVTREFGALTSNEAKLTVEPPNNIPSHSSASERAVSGKYELNVSSQASPAGRNLKLGARFADRDLGEFALRRAGNRFDVSWRAQEIQRAESVARRLSIEQGTAEQARMLALDSNVAQSYELPNRQFLVQMRASGKWLRIEPESASTARLNANQMRVADPQAGRQTMLVTELNGQEVRGEIESRVVQMQPLPNGEPGFTSKLVASEPVSARPVEIELVSGRERFTVRGKVDPGTRDFYPSKDSYPSQDSYLRGPGAAGDNTSFNNLRPDTLKKIGDSSGAEPIKQALPLTEADFAPIRRMVAENKFDDAVNLADKLSKSQGNTPEMEVFKAYLRLEEGRTQDALTVINGLKSQPDPRSVLRQITDALGRNLNPKSRESINSALNAWTNRNGITNGTANAQISSYVEKGSLRTEMRAVIRQWFGKKVTGASEIDRSSTVYLPNQDSAFKADVTIQDAMHQAISSPARYDIFELQATAIEDASPHRISDTASGQTYRRVNSGNSTADNRFGKGWGGGGGNSSRRPTTPTPSPSPSPSPALSPLPSSSDTQSSRFQPEAGKGCVPAPSSKIYIIVEKR